MKIYFDNCCYNRPFDDRTQNRIFDEANAVLSIMKRAEDNKFRIAGSSILEYEIDQMKDEDRKNKVWAVYKATITEKVNSSDSIIKKAKQICDNTNIRKKDALELASAEEGEADVFLTTDDRLIRMASKSLFVSINIMNPIDFLSELAKRERIQMNSNDETRDSSAEKR